MASVFPTNCVLYSFDRGAGLWDGRYISFFFCKVMFVSGSFLLLSQGNMISGIASCARKFSEVSPCPSRNDSHACRRVVCTLFSICRSSSRRYLCEDASWQRRLLLTTRARESVSPLPSSTDDDKADTEDATLEAGQRFSVTGPFG